jgi:hypothetical protein
MPAQYFRKRIAQGGKDAKQQHQKDAQNWPVIVHRKKLRRKF